METWKMGVQVYHELVRKHHVMTVKWRLEEDKGKNTWDICERSIPGKRQRIVHAVCAELLRHCDGESRTTTTKITDPVWVGHSLVPTLSV